MKHIFAVLIVTLFVSSLTAQTSSDLVKTYKEAFREFNANQKSPKAIMKLALASFDAGYNKQDYDLVLQYLDLKPNDSQALVLYSNILIEYGYEKKARKNLALIIDLYPGSDEAEKAQNSLDMLDRLKNPIQKLHSFKVEAGIDSNPGHLMGNDYLAIFSTALNCDVNTSSSCDFDELFDAAAYVDVQTKSDYIYDAGSTGSFFWTYGWGMASRLYAQEIDAGYLNFHLTYGFGYSWGKSSFRMPFLIKETMTKYRISEDRSRFDYFTFRINPHYRYRFDNNALFSFGMDHEEQDSPNEFKQPFGSAEYSVNKTFAFFKFQSNPNSTYPFSLMIYRGEQSQFNDNFDNNGTYYLPYSRYNLFGVDFTINHKASPSKEYKLTLGIGNKVFDDHYIPGVYPVNPGEERIDNTTLLDIQTISVNKKLSKTVLGYKLYAYESNYKPLNFTKHQLYMAYYWLP